MPGNILYSTNVWLKLLIQQKYQRDKHYVWCSETFDCTKEAKYTAAATAAPSSNPLDIYRELKIAVERSDRHCEKIKNQIASFKALAVKWEADGAINSDDKNEIVYLSDNATIDQFRPLIYLIPYDKVSTRMRKVSIEEWASITSDEYIIDDLDRSEFDVIEIL